MAKKKKPPCIRGLSRFKDGCPEKLWDGEEGCTAWIEMTIKKKGADGLDSLEIDKKCMDMWIWQFQWASLGIMEGVQHATEGNRNITGVAALVLAGKEDLHNLIRVAGKHVVKEKPEQLTSSNPQKQLKE